MSNTILKKYLGEAGAGIDESHGADRLYDVLKRFAEGLSENLNAYQATIATAIIAGMIVDEPGTLDNLRTSVAVCGTATSTVVQVHLNGSSVGSLTTAHDDTDGVKKSVDLAVAVVEGDLIELVVTTAPTSGTDLIASARIRPVTVAA